MTIKTLLTTLALTLASATAGLAACSGHEETAMTCAAGTVYDADTNTCKVVSG
ncbi:MAG: carbohydrate-binding module family 14 protein [Marivita sp.]|uniref:carbohydrate-binding module family 14 protein n=1 Tax=Marivita sp. TaxID=2003365 RepID=UPI0025BB89CB|nr:carbohydrate-binding module family 14 protein [Marivita sp.]MCI5112099.1 carbohydrate-binding module family 14 protein [Marivita sp.]